MGIHMMTFGAANKQIAESLAGAGAIKGQDGVDGANGKSAYDIAIENGFDGSEQEWLDSLKGKDGANGLDGEQNVQADWNVSDSTSDAFIKNKPIIPSAYDDTEIKNDIDNLSTTKLDVNGNASKLTYDRFTQQFNPIRNDGVQDFYGRTIELADVGLSEAICVNRIKEYDGKIYILGRGYLAYTDDLENGEKTVIVSIQTDSTMGNYDILDFAYVNNKYIFTNGYSIRFLENGSTMTQQVMGFNSNIEQFITIDDNVYGLDRTSKRIYQFDGGSWFTTIFELEGDYANATIYGVAQDSQNFAMIGMTGNVIVYNPMDKMWQLCDDYLSDTIPFEGTYTIMDIVCYNDIFYYIGKSIDDDYMYIEGMQCYNYEDRQLKYTQWEEGMTSKAALPLSFYNGGSQLIIGNDILMMPYNNVVYSRNMLHNLSSLADNENRLDMSIQNSYRSGGAYNKGTFYIGESHRIFAVDLKIESKTLADDITELIKENTQLKSTLMEYEDRIKLLEELMQV